MEHFINSYVKRHKVKPNYHAGIAWVSMQVMTQAIEKAGSHDRQKVWSTLRTSQFQTIMGKWKVDENNLNDHDGLTFQILDGQRKIVWPKKIAEVPLQAADAQVEGQGQELGRRKGIVRSFEVKRIDSRPALLSVGRDFFAADRTL